MTQSTRYLIVGAGPVGLTAALELARRGHEPLIIDNDGLPSPESRALAIHARTLDILEPSGATERLLAKGHRINGMMLRADGRDQMQLAFQDLPHRFNFILSLPQSQTETTLIETLNDHGADVAWHTEAETFSDGPAGYEVCCKTPDGETLQIGAEHLIGADGAHSPVRKFLGQDFTGTTEPETFGLADIELSDWPFPADYAVINRNADQLVAFFPFAEGRGRFVCNRPDILNRLPAEAKVKRAVWQSEFRISYRQVASYQKGNAFLAGDAAHIHSPVGGRGMNLGIEDAATLAWLLDIGAPERYTDLRHPVGEHVLNYTRQQTAQITSTNPLLRFAQGTIAPLALKIPPLRRMALRRLSGLDTPAPPWLQPPP